MTTAVGKLRAAISRHRWLWLTIVAAFPLLYHVLMLLALVTRFAALPNYYVVYDWPGNVAEIIRSTPAVSDMLPIVRDEWLFEVGRMNYDYGNGISEWSMSLIPAKLLIVMCAGALVASTIVLLLPTVRRCTLGQAGSTGAVTGLGAGLVGLSSLTMTWVVCCATPSWIVGLAMLGVSVSTATWLESFGPWLNALGFALLLAGVVWLAARSSGAEEADAITNARNTSLQTG